MTESAQRAQQIDLLDQLLSCLDKIKTRDEYKIDQPITLRDKLWWLHNGGDRSTIPGYVAYTEEDIVRRHDASCQDLGNEFYAALMKLSRLKFVPPPDWFYFATQITNRRFDADRISEITSQVLVQKLAIEVTAQEIAPANKPKKEERITVNDRMQAALIADLANVKGLKAREWAVKLNCSESAVKESPAWIGLQAARAGIVISQSKDRNRKTRPKKHDE